jgi:hypothetical protein
MKIEFKGPIFIHTIEYHIERWIIEYNIINDIFNVSYTDADQFPANAYVEFSKLETYTTFALTWEVYLAQLYQNTANNSLSRYKIIK